MSWLERNMNSVAALYQVRRSTVQGKIETARWHVKIFFVCLSFFFNMKLVTEIKFYDRNNMILFAF